MFDICFKLMRKALPKKAYSWLQRSPIGRVKGRETFSTYASIATFYRELPSVQFRDKIVVELGCGLQFYTGLFFLQAGAKTVFLVEPKFSCVDLPSALKRAHQVFSTHQPGFPVSLKETQNRIIVARDLSLIDSSYNGSINFLCSHLVLEHLYSLDPFLQENVRLLSASGISYHLVDLSDHTYHVFSKYARTKRFAEQRALFHLRYSNATFRRLNDRKCYMNRILLPVYLDKVSRFGLHAEVFARVPYRRVPIHKDLLRGQSGVRKEDLYLTSFRIKLTKTKA